MFDDRNLRIELINNINVFRRETKKESYEIVTLFLSALQDGLEPTTP
jgi:hypothetical protein